MGGVENNRFISDVRFLFAIGPFFGVRFGGPGVGGVENRRFVSGPAVATAISNLGESFPGPGVEGLFRVCSFRLV